MNFLINNQYTDKKIIKSPKVRQILISVKLVFVCMLAGMLTVHAEVTPQAYASVRQGITVTGTVADANGETMPGVNVVVKGATIGTVTDFNGAYSIQVPNEDAALVFSFMGYITREIVVGSRTVVDVSLQEDARQIEEVVVTALGIKRSQKALSYNVQEVSGDELNTVKSANFMNALTGKVAGAQINPGAAGPGAAVKVVLRGNKSISGNNNALYVIDGIPMYNNRYGNSDGFMSSQSGTESAADINPDDIESITLLTGPSAAALYGYEASNGVILITTKRGQADKLTVTVSNSTIFSDPLILPEFQNKYGNIPGESVSWGKETPFRFEPAKFFNTGSNVTNSLSVQSGNERSQTYFSAASTNANGILPNNRYDRYNFTVRNTTSFLNDRFVLDAGANYIIQKDKNMVSQGQYFNPIPAVYLFPRGEDFDAVRLFERYDEAIEKEIQYWPYGEMGISLQNPYWIMNRMNREKTRNRYILTASLKYNITDWLNVVGRISTDNSVYNMTEKRNAGTLVVFAGPKGYFSNGYGREQQVYGDLIANLNTYVGDFSFHINLGTSVKDFSTDSQSTMGYLYRYVNWFSVENLDRVGAGFKMNQGASKQRSTSVFGNAEIGFKSMVYLTLTGRNDWDSALAFSERNSFAFFYPSVGLSGIISEMVDLPDWFSYLKTRLSYTSVGSSISLYQTREFRPYDEQSHDYNAITRYPNKNLKPEFTNAFEAGLNMRFFKGALHFDATWYKSNTLNQTFGITLPPTSGYTSVNVQTGDVENTGIETALGYDLKMGAFRWETNLTYSFNKNTIKQLAHGLENPVTGEIIEMPFLDRATLGAGGAPIVRLTEGGTMGDLYVNREWLRSDNGLIYLNPTTLVPTLINGEYKKVGSILPKSFAGWRNSFSYQGLTLNVLINGRFGGLVVSNTQAILDRFGVSKNSAELREEGVVINGQNVPVREYLDIVAAGTGQGARYVYDATNIRLGEVSIHYTIPKKWVGNIADITVGLVGSNLALLYCKAPFDPEIVPSAINTYYTGVDYFMHPSLRNYGFNVKFQF